MKQNEADLLIEIGKLLGKIEEINGRLKRLEARPEYHPYRHYYPYGFPYLGSVSGKPSEVAPTWTSSGSYAPDGLDIRNSRPGKIELVDEADMDPRRG